ncbi:MAG: hypothetical protein H6Q28_1062, partial [Bacteroidetes bacterium]|nr:hypothetical protein [Bacteroidota bacterium]
SRRRTRICFRCATASWTIRRNSIPERGCTENFPPCDASRTAFWNAAIGASRRTNRLTPDRTSFRRSEDGSEAGFLLIAARTRDDVFLLGTGNPQSFLNSHRVRNAVLIRSGTGLAGRDASWTVAVLWTGICYRFPDGWGIDRTVEKGTGPSGWACSRESLQKGVPADGRVGAVRRRGSGATLPCRRYAGRMIQPGARRDCRRRSRGGCGGRAFRGHCERDS